MYCYGERHYDERRYVEFRGALFKTETCCDSLLSFRSADTMTIFLERNSPTMFDLFLKNT